MPARQVYSRIVSMRLNPCFGGRCRGAERQVPNFMQVGRRLNPCFGGRCRGALISDLKRLDALSLNPCFGGRCRGAREKEPENWKAVLS